MSKQVSFSEAEESVKLSISKTRSTLYEEIHKKPLKERLERNLALISALRQYAVAVDIALRKGSDPLEIEAIK